MSKSKFTFNLPEGWHVISPEYYRDFSILSTELVPCIYGFAIERPRGNGYDVVSVCDYGPWEDCFIEELKSALKDLEKDPTATGDVNDFIEDNAQGFSVKSTTYMNPVFYKSTTFRGKPCFINIMKIITNANKSYSLQAFFNVDGDCVCFGTSISKIDEISPLNTAISRNDHVYDMFYVLIKSFEAKKPE